jgi:type I restriction enzyme R subunit
MNDLFGAEAFTESQIREFVNGLVQRLLAYPDLVKQTQVNSKKQFLESQDFQSAVTEAVIDNQGAHNAMADYFFSDGPGINGVVLALADAFYEAAIDQKACESCLGRSSGQVGRTNVPSHGIVDARSKGVVLWRQMSQIQKSCR